MESVDGRGAPVGKRGEVFVVLVTNPQNRSKCDEKVNSTLVVFFVFDQSIKNLRSPLRMADIGETGDSSLLEDHIDLSGEVVFAKLLKIIIEILPSLSMEVELHMFSGVVVATIVSEPNIVTLSGEGESRGQIPIVRDPLVGR